MFTFYPFIELLFCGLVDISEYREFLSSDAHKRMLRFLLLDL